MKNLRIVLLTVFSFVILVGLQNCKDDSKENDQQATINILKSKTWKVSSVSVPVNSATESSDWVNFKVSFSDVNMTTADYPTGAQAVWPSGTYSVSSDGKSITREDGVTMTLNPITESNFTSRFIVADSVELGGRIAALGGEYTFNME